MDMLMLVKKTRVLSDIENVSKTKIRGIFALLKNSHAMVTAGPDGESVRINLGKGITTFRHFREKQDSFISKCVTLQQIFIPYEMKGDLIWQLDPVTMQLRIEELWRLEVIVHEFISNELTKIRTGAGNRNQQTVQRARTNFAYHPPGQESFPGSHYGRDRGQNSLPMPPHAGSMYDNNSFHTGNDYHTRGPYQGSSYTQDYATNELYSGSSSFPSTTFTTWPSSTASAAGDTSPSPYIQSEHSSYFEDERSSRG
jgi:hypothetical protein